MSFRQHVASTPRPASVRNIELPRREHYFPSPIDWRDEVLYFLLPDRFSDGHEDARPLLDRSNLTGARPTTFGFDRWAKSGSDRWQGGTIKGIRSKLSYLDDLGVSTLWIGPLFKQRVHRDTYHGYAIQDFLTLDARFGSRADLIALVDAAHSRGMRVILDIIFNHSGCNWIYANGEREPPYRQFPAFYQKGAWLDRDEAQVLALAANEDDTGVWPAELQADDYYTRAGRGSLGAGSFDDPQAEFRRTDFMDMRDFNYDTDRVLDDVARCFKYWIALSDCDGFRLDTLKHVTADVGRNFCGTIKEYAANLGKANFLLVGEVAGADSDAQRYRTALGRNLHATLDIGAIRRTLHRVAKGLEAPQAYLNFERIWDDDLGSHRESGQRHVSILDDHDHVSGEKIRFSSDAASDVQVIAGVALQLFSLGIPCIYYGTEQSFAGPERSEREQYLPDYNAGDPPPDKYLREAMFGPEHPLKSGAAGFGAPQVEHDAQLPGFGAFGTSGHHCFDPNAPAYKRIRALCALRKQFPVLRSGRQYQRALANFAAAFALPAAGELIAWSRILDDEEALCVVNGHGRERRGGDVEIDARLNAEAGATLAIVANTEQSGGGAFDPAFAVGLKLPVRFRNGNAFVEIRNLGPSEVIVLSNRP